MKSSFTKKLTKYSFYLAAGFSLSQLFHTLAFSQVKWATIVAFPQFALPLRYAFIFSLTIGVLVFLTLKIGGRRIFEKLSLFLSVVIISLLISQIFGRSFIKFGFESLFWFIVFLSFHLDKNYSIEVLKTKDIDFLNFRYNELWGFLNLAVTISLLWLGAAVSIFGLGVFWERYFRAREPIIVEYQMLRCGILFVYSMLGIGWFIFQPLLSKLYFIKQVTLD